MRSDRSGLLREALEPVLVPIGFQPGQEGQGQLIFCAGHDALSHAYPRLPQAWKQPAGVGACIDLVVDLIDGGIQRLDLEGRSLATTLAAVGEPTLAESVAEFADVPLVDVIARVQRAVSVLFSSPGPAT